MEVVNHNLNAVVSQLHHYFTKIEPRVDAATAVGLHMDSCVEQNNNVIVLGYCMLRVIHGYYKRIDH